MSSRGSVLREVVVARKRRVEEARARVPVEQLRRTAETRSDFRDFAAALSRPPTDRGPLRVIAELKRASPSRGLLRRDYRPREIAGSYEAAGAAALSVLTEQDHFLGSLNDLVEARDAARLPALRKDFILDEYQVYESAAAGADALLLIVAALEDEGLRRLLALSRSMRMATLVEVHEEEELDRALEAGAEIIGVNNRDLKTLEVNLETSFRLRGRIPPRCVAVSESGIRAPADLRRLSETGFDAVLIGEHLIASEDPGHELADLLAGLRNFAAPQP